MVKVKEDMTGWVMSEHGVKDSRWTVIERADDRVSPSGHKTTMWLCECSCEAHNRKIIAGTELRNGKSTSCGCRLREVAFKKHKLYNTYDLDSCEYGIGYTGNGEEFWFDKEDYELIKDYYWYYDDHGYVRAFDCDRKKQIRLHILVMSPTPNGMEIDHKTHPGGNLHKKDNRKSNLEFKTRLDNMKNQAIRSTNTSGITGVSWHKKYQQWSAQICINYKQVHLGLFDKKEDAINARKEAEVKYFGDHRYDMNN